MTENVQKAPREFVLRRLHSLLGLFIVFFLIEHIITNSQAALLFGDNGAGFVRMVNLIKNLPYLPVIEVCLIGIPILFHAAMGVKYIFTSKVNTCGSKGEKPTLKYSRNRAYSWQRYTSWILLIGIILHVGYMRFYRYPTHAQIGDQKVYFAKVAVDKGLYTVASRLGVKLYSQEDINSIKSGFESKKKAGEALEKRAFAIENEEEKKDFETWSLERLDSIDPVDFDRNDQILLDKAQDFRQKANFVKALSSKSITNSEVIAQTKDFGTAVLLVVRDSFKSPLKCLLYTVFVLATAFHAFNGLWTFMMTWGLIIKMRSQRSMVNVCVFLMTLIALLGLFSVWGTYFINLYR